MAHCYSLEIAARMVPWATEFHPRGRGSASAKHDLFVLGKGGMTRITVVLKT